MNNKKLTIIFSFLLILGMVNAATISDINVTAPIATITYSHKLIIIDFNISDIDTNAAGILLDLNYSTSATQGTGTVIVDDLNLLLAGCSSNSLNTGAVQCSVTFNPINVTDSATYTILAYAFDGNNLAAQTNFDTSGSFIFNKLEKEDLLCTAISDDLFQANGCVDSDGFEDATTSSLSIGMLEAGDSSGLAIFLLIFGGLVTITFGAVAGFVLLKGRFPFTNKK